MTTLTVQAEDTATAMEQIADQLGAGCVDPIHNKARWQNHHARL